MTARVQSDAARIHHLTEQLDEARLEVGATADRLRTLTLQHDNTVRSLASNRTILVQQAQQAYMQGGVSVQMQSMRSADLTLNQEYLKVATGDVTDAGDQLRQVEVQLRAQETSMQAAQQANAQATLNLQTLRTHALSIAASDQSQLDSVQAQIAAAQRAASAASSRATQGLPVNGGFVNVIQQAAGLPVAKPIVSSSSPASPVASSPSAPSPPVPAAPVQTTPPATTTGGSSGGSSGGAGGVWQQLRLCESGGNYAENTGNGFYGAYQFSQSTWTNLGYPGRPDQEPPAMQDAAAMKDQAVSGWGQWPACSAALGLL